MKALKKQLAFLLSVISVLCILPITASAKEESEQKQYIKLNAPIILEKGNEVEFKFGINDGYYEFSPVFRPISSTAQSVKYIKPKLPKAKMPTVFLTPSTAFPPFIFIYQAII